MSQHAKTISSFAEAERYFLSLANIANQRSDSDARARRQSTRARVQALLDLLGNPERAIPRVIHVTGTSGKGSVCSFLESILQADKQSVGMITSPHATIMTERWRVNKKSMATKDFIALTEKIAVALDHYIQETPFDIPSYSELMTVMGFLYLAKSKVDWAIVEVACGGRYDATNVLPKKDAAVITNIGLDHTHILGETKEEIADEKIGIITPQSLVFAHERNPNLRHRIMAAAQAVGAQFVESVERPDVTASGLRGTTFVYKSNPFELTCLGAHQVDNATLAIDIAEHLDIPTASIVRGLKSTIQPIRMELVHERPWIMLDGAHNPDKIESSVATILQLAEGKIPWKSVHLVLGFSANKPIAKLLEALVPLAPASIACTRNTTNPYRKAAEPKELSKLAESIFPGIPIEPFVDPAHALAWSRTQASKQGLILVTGSIFLSGELRGHGPQPKR